MFINNCTDGVILLKRKKMVSILTNVYIMQWTVNVVKILTAFLRSIILFCLEVFVYINCILIKLR